MALLLYSQNAKVFPGMRYCSRCPQHLRPDNFHVCETVKNAMDNYVESKIHVTILLLYLHCLINFKGLVKMMMGREYQY